MKGIPNHKLLFGGRFGMFQGYVGKFLESCKMCPFLLGAKWCIFSRQAVTLPETNTSTLKIGLPKRTLHLPTIHFQVRTVSFRDTFIEMGGEKSTKMLPGKRSHIPPNGKRNFIKTRKCPSKVPFR